MSLPPDSLLVSGPVIIEGNKVLLNKEKKGEKITSWMFPGGEVEDFDSTLEEACRREVKEEMGIDVEIIKPLKPVMLYQDGRVIVLIHWLARRIGEVKPGEGIVDWGWHDVKNLPADCAPNVYEVINDCLAQKISI